MLHCSQLSIIEHRMFYSSRHSLKLLAALVWYSGAFVLSIKSSRLLLEAHNIRSELFWITLAIVAGLIIGTIKAKYLFKRLCIKNLKRIDAIEQPKLWHFYRLRFFFFLLVMILLGSFAYHQAHGNYTALLTMATIELSLATALLGSSTCFWKK